MITRKTLFVGALCALLVVSLSPVGKAEGPRPMIVRVHVDSPQDAAHLMGHFDETHNHGDDEIELLLWPGDQARLDALDLDYDVVIEDLWAHDMEQSRGPKPILSLPGPDRDDYRRLDDYATEMAELAESNPKLVKLFEMKRPSLEGRTIHGVEIAANVKKTDDGRPIYYIDGIHHAREWPASEYTILFVHYLVEKYGKDPNVTSLLRKARVIAVPVVNVDGFDYSREAVTSANQSTRNNTSLLGSLNGFEGYWRKNRRSATGATVPVVQRNPDAFGVDPNRNYPFEWGDSQGGSSGNQFDQTYRGEAPFSEPETENVRDIILGRPVTGVITNHTYQATVLRTGGGKAPDDKALVKIGSEMAKILGYELRATVGYPTTGTTDDWAYAAMGALGFTIENSRLGFHPAYADEVGAFWKEHMKAFMVMFEASADPRYHSVIKGRVLPRKATLKMTKKFGTPLSSGNPTGEDSITEKLKMPVTTNKDGTFEWHLGPSSRPYEKKPESYTLTISAGGKTKTMKIRVDRGQVLNLGTIRL
jgi:hypothetical protein